MLEDLWRKLSLGQFTGKQKLRPGITRYREQALDNVIILLMEDILHHLGYIKTYKNPVNNGIFTISTGAGFLNHQQYHPTISQTP